METNAPILIDSVACLRKECQKPPEMWDFDVIVHWADRLSKEARINKLVKGCHDSSLTGVIELLEDKFRADQLVMETTLEAIKNEPEKFEEARNRDRECRKALMREVQKERENREKLLNAIFNDDDDDETQPSNKGF